MKNADSTPFFKTGDTVRLKGWPVEKYAIVLHVSRDGTFADLDGCRAAFPVSDLELCDPPAPPLLEQLIAHLREWFPRAAKRVRDDAYGAEIKIRIHHAGGDDDGVLCLGAEVTEEGPRVDFEGRVPGVRFK